MAIASNALLEPFRRITLPSNMGQKTKYKGRPNGEFRTTTMPSHFFATVDAQINWIVLTRLQENANVRLWY